MTASSGDGQVKVNSNQDTQKNSLRLAYTEFSVSERTTAQFLASSDGPLKVWLGKPKATFNRAKKGKYRPDSDRFTVELASGLNRMLIMIDANDKRTRFHVRFRRQSSKAEHERLARAALQSRGNVQRGREVFVNADKSLCAKCHRIGDGSEGGRIGPDLTGIGSRFSRIHLVESLLEPSRTIAPSYATLVIALSDGRVLTGVKVAETDDTLTVGDNQAKTHEVAKSDIEDSRVQEQSTMPEGIEKRLTEREFVDLIAFLVSQKK